MQILPASLRILPFAVIAGCGGGAGDPISPPVSLNTVPAAGSEQTAQIEGSTSRYDFVNNEIDAADVVGTYNLVTGALTIDNGEYRLVDTDGPDASGKHSDTNGTLEIVERSESYDSARLFYQEYDYGSGRSSNVGVFGIPTSFSDMPTSGSASYAGFTWVYAYDGSNITNMVGNSNVTVDFGSRVGAASLGGFVSTDNATGQPATSPFDNIGITGFRINGSDISGGELRTYKNGTETSFIGQNLADFSVGRLYGFDAASGQPDEVGGTFVSVGDQGTVEAVYLAD